MAEVAASSPPPQPSCQRWKQERNRRQSLPHTCHCRQTNHVMWLNCIRQLRTTQGWGLDPKCFSSWSWLVHVYSRVRLKESSSQRVKKARKADHQGVVTARYQRSWGQGGAVTLAWSFRERVQGQRAKEPTYQAEPSAQWGWPLVFRKNQPKRCAKGNDWWLWDELRGSCQWTERTHQLVGPKEDPAGHSLSRCEVEFQSAGNCWGANYCCCWSWEPT